MGRAEVASFASGGSEGDNGVDDFFRDLQLIYSLRECSGASRFADVVLIIHEGI